MGRKGDSKRKPKKSNPVTTSEAGNNSIVGAIKRPAVQSVVADKGAARGGVNPSSGANKSQRKGG
jgi:hypothetical protein